MAAHSHTCPQVKQKLGALQSSSAGLTPREAEDGLTGTHEDLGRTLNMTTDFFLNRLQPLLVFVWIMLWRIQNLITANFFLPHDIVYASLSLPTNTHNHHACFRAQGFSVWKHTKLLARGGRSASSPCTPFWGSCFSLGPLPSIRAPGTQVLWVHFVRKKKQLSEKTQSTFPPQSTVRNRWTLKVTTGHKYFFNLINYLTQIYTGK